MFSKPIRISDAVIRAIHHKIEDSKVQTRILVTGRMYSELADILGAKKLLYNDNGIAKAGFRSVQLDTGCAAYRATFEGPSGLKQSFELISGDSTDQYVVEASEDDGLLRLKFRLNYHGDPHLPIAYVSVVGNAESLLKITPLQTEMDGGGNGAGAHKAAVEDDEEDEDDESDSVDMTIHGEVESNPAEPVRQTLLPRDSRKAKTKRAAN